jgi:hypothetical protein
MPTLTFPIDAKPISGKFEASYFLPDNTEGTLDVVPSSIIAPIPSSSRSSSIFKSMPSSPCKIKLESSRHYLSFLSNSLTFVFVSSFK